MVKLRDVMSRDPVTFSAETDLVDAIEVLAESSPSLKFSKPHPVAWVTRHEQARVVGLTLGHDERTHDHPAFKALLVNAVTWVGRK